MGLYIDVAIQLKSKVAPFVITLHGTSNGPSNANFFIQTLVGKFEVLLQTTYTYFSSSHKKHLEHGTLAKLFETKGLKLLHNVNIRWISMLFPTK